MIRVPSQQEYDNSKFVIEMMSESLDWDPQNSDLAKLEAAMLDLRGHVGHVDSAIVARG